MYSFFDIVHEACCRTLVSLVHKLPWRPTRWPWPTFLPWRMPNVRRLQRPLIGSPSSSVPTLTAVERAYRRGSAFGERAKLMQQ